jgi:hypothetical protein
VGVQTVVGKVSAEAKKSFSVRYGLFQGYNTGLASFRIRTGVIAML